MPIVVAGLSHKTSPVNIRECFAFEEEEIPRVLEALTSSGMASEAVILSTCNRVEIYIYTEKEDPCPKNVLRNFLIENRNYQLDLFEEIYSFGGSESVEHLFKVASGLDSMVLGETEILGQIKKAYDIALQAQFTGGKLNKAFQKAFNTAKFIRTETNIQRGSISVGSVGVELAEKIFESLNDSNVMVIGAGDTSEKTARALLSRGAKSIMVSNRSFDRAETLAKDLGGRAIKFDSWAEEFANIDIMISSTSAPHYVIDRERLEPMMKSRHNRPLLLIDLAVPRDIEPEVNFMDNVYVYNVDDLQNIAQSYLEQRQSEIKLCESIVRERAAGLFGPHPRKPRRDGHDGFEPQTGEPAT
ncbi:glutamyl-tRNA reductase [Verrucomicrobia bacterium]|nr:glutamyl-tRNA reductase [Verrucomicrobiota bacterium]